MKDDQGQLYFISFMSFCTILFCGSRLCTHPMERLGPRSEMVCIQWKSCSLFPSQSSVELCSSQLAIPRHITGSDLQQVPQPCFSFPCMNWESSKPGDPHQLYAAKRIIFRGWSLQAQDLWLIPFETVWPHPPLLNTNLLQVTSGAPALPECQKSSKNSMKQLKFCTLKCSWGKTFLPDQNTPALSTDILPFLHVKISHSWQYQRANIKAPWCLKDPRKEFCALTAIYTRCNVYCAWHGNEAVIS